MIKRFSGQEIFILTAAVVALLFMYTTLMISESEPITTTYDTNEDEQYKIVQSLLTIAPSEIKQIEAGELEEQYVAYSTDNLLQLSEQRSGE
ncbi:hypothetical protein [Halalkalibacter nanhaiisediminis]|uniref:Uncharacterized protein n=1 Tax=Halalkalibacter nanhaiisediminis TaxID=688079 RepID=A0A562QRM3_9BACI|nr:hypothetical protein [Halalkalibacter nanhaiisediminis]TWI59347.1 hypothetical protein IQ10_01063 [Halalkalibacter nanhaiisediminis]